MKPNRFSRLLAQSKTLRSFGLALTAPVMVFTMTSAQAGTATPAAPAEAAPLTNWVGFTIGGAFVDGNDAGMMRRTRTNGDFYGGIDSFHFAQDLKDSTTLTLDGHALPGLEDYAFNANLEKINLGYIKAGYKQFRTWYDGSGGYMPQLANQYAEPSWGDEMHVDRGEFSLEAGLRMENLPEVTFSYRHTFRDGTKDSTSWGARPLLQVAGTGSLGTTNFEFAPSFWNLDEKSDIFGLEVEHTLGNTDLGLGLNYEHTSYTNSLNTRTGAVTQNPTTGVTTANSQVATSKTDEYSMDLFSGNIHSVTRFSDKLWLTAGFAYTTVDTDTNGWEQLASPVNPSTSFLTGSTASTTKRVIPTGGSEFESCVGNLNLMWNPIADLTITPSVRIEQSSQDAITLMTQTVTTNLGVVTNTDPYQLYTSDINSNSDTAALDLRYTGISDLVLYAKGEWGQEDQTSWYRNNLLATSTTGVFREESTIDSQEYRVGANWYPIRCLSFALQGLYSERNAEYDPSANGANATGVSSLMPDLMKEHDTTTDGINLRATWHALNNLSLVTRYDYRETEFENSGIRWSPNALYPTQPPSTPPATPSGTSNPINGTWPEVQSGIMRSNIVSESINWTPMDRLYVQASASYTWSQTEQNTIWVPDSQNDYFSGSLSVGYAIDDRTDITASYTYYNTKNYTQQGSPYTATTTAAIPYAMGYGLNTNEHAVSVSLNRILTPNMVLNLRYGFITSNTDGTDQTGGNNDFDAQMVSAGLKVRF